MYENLTFRSTPVMFLDNENKSLDIFCLEEQHELTNKRVIEAWVAEDEVFVLFTKVIDEEGNWEPILPSNGEKEEAFEYLTNKLEEIIFEESNEEIFDSYCICNEQSKMTDMTGEGHMAFEPGDFEFPNYINLL